MRKILTGFFGLLVVAAAHAATPIYSVTGASSTSGGAASSAWGITSCPAGQVLGRATGGTDGAPVCFQPDYTLFGTMPDTNIPLATSYDSYTYQSAYNAYLHSLIMDPPVCDAPLQCPTGTSGTTGHQTIEFSSLNKEYQTVRFEQRVPLIMGSSGTFGNNGALTLTTALDTTFSNAYLYFAANVICSGSAAGWHWAVMSSTTVGTVYQDVYTSGVPAVVSSPTAYSCTGPGAYTQTTSEIQALTYTITGGSMGSTGVLKSVVLGGYPSSANAKTIRYYFGGSQFGSYQDATSGHTQSQPEHVIRNISSAVNISGNFVLNQPAAGTLYKRTINTASDQTYYISIQLANAAEFYEMLVSDVTVNQ